MRIHDKPYRTIWLARDGWSVEIIDQTKLPHEFEIATLRSMEDAAHAILTMQVRGAPLIGATAAYGLCLAVRQDPSDAAIDAAVKFLSAQRPTAINLKWALELMRGVLHDVPKDKRVETAYARAATLCDDDVETNRKIGENGLGLIRDVHEMNEGARVNILTHCNAGWLACVDWGTATSPIYQAYDAGIDVHVWVDETRPRNQGAALTAYELGAHGIPHTIIVDNAGGHLMREGQVDLCFVGTDRTASNGDVCNKIGTYLKALAAVDNNVPFYVTLPFSTIDWSIKSGAEIPIEERGAEEVLEMRGRDGDGTIREVSIAAPGSPAGNFAFDVTPARLVTGLVTERGIAEASTEGLKNLYPELARHEANHD